MNKEYVEILYNANIQLQKLPKALDNLDNALTEVYQIVDALKYDLGILEEKIKRE